MNQVSEDVHSEAIQECIVKLKTLKPIQFKNPLYLFQEIPNARLLNQTNLPILLVDLGILNDVHGKISKLS